MVFLKTSIVFDDFKIIKSVLTIVFDDSQYSRMSKTIVKTIDDFKFENRQKLL